MLMRYTSVIRTAMTTTGTSTLIAMFTRDFGSETEHLAMLRLLQICDSAFPIGTAAHSFGLEGIVESGALNVENLHAFLQDYLTEGGVLEAWHGRRAHRL